MLKLDPKNEGELDLVRRIACAFISHQLGVSYQTCWKNYNFANAIPGPVWFEVTEHAIESYQKAPDNLFDK